MSERKLRLFACACCRLMWHEWTNPRAKFAVESAERYADGLASLDELRHARKAVRGGWPSPMRLADIEELPVADRIDWSSSECAAFVTAAEEDWPFIIDADDVIKNVQLVAGDQAFGLSREEATGRLICYLRDIFGNPFRPVVCAPAWLTSDVLALARGIYDERAFDRMPILADALQDAGCTNDDVLNHCRDEAVHVRGCWVVDLLVGKA